MSAKDIIELYGKSVYQIRLEVAMRLVPTITPEEALVIADAFVTALEDELLEELVEKFS